MFKAYPRVCGATGNFATVTNGEDGLSPRVRGNLLHVDCL